MTAAELAADLLEVVGDAIDATEADLGRDLTDAERGSIADEILAGLDDEEATMNREAVIESLATNCDCFAKNADVLELLDDEQLAEIAAGREVVNAVREAAPGLTLNAMPAAVKKKMAAKDDPEDEEDGGADEDEENPDGTKKKKKAPMTTQNADEWLRAAPPEVRTVLNHAESILNREKSAIVDRLVANVAEGNRPARIAKLMKQDLSELQEQLEQLGPQAPQAVANGYVGQYGGALPPSYLGAAAPANNAQRAEEERPLEFPVINWDEPVDARKKA